LRKKTDNEAGGRSLVQLDGGLDSDSSLCTSLIGATKLSGSDAGNNAMCTQARKTMHGLDGQHQDVDRTPR